MLPRNLPTWARDLIEGERVARLAFVDREDRPRVLPVTFVHHGGAVWSAIDRKPKRTAEPARVRWLRRRPEAAVCIDVYDDDWERLAWVQLLGTVEVVEAERASEALGALTAKYPQYGPQPPPGPVLRLEIERALWWRAADQPS